MILLVLGWGLIVLLNHSSGKRRRESLQCVNNMLALGAAARMWANDNGDRLPPSFLAMSNELVTPRLLHCPADPTRPPLTHWADVTPESTSYEIISPGMPESDTHTVYLRCLIHGYAGYADATVFDGVERRGKQSR